MKCCHSLGLLPSGVPHEVRSTLVREKPLYIWRRQARSVEATPPSLAETS